MKKKLMMPLIAVIMILSLTSCALLKKSERNAETEPKVMAVLVNGVDYRCLDKESFKAILKEAGREW